MMARLLFRWRQRPELWLVAGTAVFSRRRRRANDGALSLNRHRLADSPHRARPRWRDSLCRHHREPPPALFLLAVPPIAFGRLIGIDPTHAYHVWISGFILVSLMLCRAISRNAVFEQRPVTRRAFLLSGVVLLTVVPLHHYGQPGHVVTVLMLPYLLSAARRAAGRGVSIRLAILAGLLAGAGIALKPFFVIPWLCVELFVRIRTRQPRSLMAPENICIAAIQAVFLGTVFIGFTAYVTSILPLAIELFNAHNIPLVILLMCQRRSKSTPLAGVKMHHLMRFSPPGQPWAGLSGFWGFPSFLALVETVAVAVHLQDMNVVCEPVQQRPSQALGTEHLGPLIER